MSTHPAPSTYILRKAWQLGQKMATKERRLKPDLTGAYEYPTYVLFAQVHRYRLEQRPGYQFWDEKLQALIEREGNGRGVPLDNPRIWDAFYTHIGGPIRDVFWAAWESAYGLQALYAQALAKDQRIRMARSRPLDVSSSVPPSVDLDDFDTWDKIADKLAAFLDGEDSDKLWAGLSPDAQADQLAK